MGRDDDRGFGMGGALKLGAIASAIAGGYKFAEFAVRLKKLHEVGSENAVFIRLIQRANLDLQETDRLLRLPEVKYALSQSPGKVAWIQKSIDSLCEAMEEMGQYTEKVGKDLEKSEHVKARHRVKWVMHEYEKLMHRRMELSMNHQGLLQVLAFLSPLEPLACCQEDANKKNREKKTVVVRQTTRGPESSYDRYEGQSSRRKEQDIYRYREERPGGVVRTERRETTTRRVRGGEEYPQPRPQDYERAARGYERAPSAYDSAYESEAPSSIYRSHWSSSKL